MKKLLLCGVAVVVVIGLMNMPDKDKRDIAAGLRASTAGAAGDPKNTALRDTKLDFRWNKSGFGSVMMADFKVHNPTLYRFKDFEITCTDFGASGTEIDRNKKVIYDIVQAKSTKSLKQVNMGFLHTQATSTSCEITDLIIDPAN
jgi:hypothetical protein